MHADRMNHASDQRAMSFAFTKEEIAAALEEVKAQKAGGAHPPVPATTAPTPSPLTASKSDAQKDLEGVLYQCMKEVQGLRSKMHRQYVEQGPGKIIGSLERRTRLLYMVDELAAVDPDHLEKLEDYVRMLRMSCGIREDSGGEE